MLVLLEERGLVERAPHDTDGRARSVTLTAKGRRSFARLWMESEPVRGQLVAAFRPEEAGILVDFLARVVRAMTPSRADKPPRHVKGRKR
jgi:DNA-binding MarR family transcriptional regulator